MVKTVHSPPKVIAMNIETNEPAPRVNNESVSLFSQAMDGINSNFQSLKLSAENFGSEELAKGLALAQENPIATAGYAMGAVLGGTAAVLCLPMELTVGGAIVVAAGGAALVDGGAYLAEKALAKEFS